MAQPGQIWMVISGNPKLSKSLIFLIFFTKAVKFLFLLGMKAEFLNEVLEAKFIFHFKSQPDQKLVQKLPKMIIQISPLPMSKTVLFRYHLEYVE